MRFRPTVVSALALLVALVVGFFVSGHYLWQAMIGLDPAAFPAGATFQAIGKLLLPDVGVSLAGAVLSIAILLIVGAATFLAVRSSRRTQLIEADPTRRNLLAGGLAGAAAALGATVAGGAAMLGRTMAGIGNGGRGWSGPIDGIFNAPVVKTNPEWKPEWHGSRVQAYGRLGRTEWPVSDTVLGTGPLRGELGEKVARLAIERGINYIDTAPDYSGSGSEQAIGRAIRGFPRDRLFIATKFCTPVGHLPPGTPVEDYKRAIEASLGRLGTDYVDLIHVHSCDEVERLMDPNVHEAFDRLRQEGKARFIGFSSHTPNLVKVATTAIESGRFDVMMLAYHHGIWPELDDVIHRARKQRDMGVVAMKTLKGARQHGLEDFRGKAGSYAQAALKWVHSNPDVSCAVISFFELQHVDEYLYASGQKLANSDRHLLEEYDAAIAGSYCAPHCGACLGSCPEGLPVNDILRYRMYFEDYRSEQEAMRLYGRLEKDAAVCAGCPAPCADACPLGVPIRDRALGAHQLLTGRYSV